MDTSSDRNYTDFYWFTNCYGHNSVFFTGVKIFIVLIFMAVKLSKSYMTIKVSTGAIKATKVGRKSFKVNSHKIWIYVWFFTDWYQLLWYFCVFSASFYGFYLGTYCVYLNVLLRSFLKKSLFSKFSRILRSRRRSTSKSPENRNQPEPEQQS